MIYCRDLGFCYLPQKSIGFYFTWALNYWWLIFILWRHGFRLLLGGSILVLHPLDVRPWMCSLLLMCDSSGVSTGRLRGYQAPPIWWSLNSKLCFPSIDRSSTHQSEFWKEKWEIMGQKAIFMKVMSENFLQLIKDTSPQIQAAQLISGMTNKRKCQS